MELPQAAHKTGEPLSPSYPAPPPSIWQNSRVLPFVVVTQVDVTDPWAAAGESVWVEQAD